MAAGDLAASYGFTPVAPSDDIRLGYDAINRAADLAVLRSVRSYPSKAALDQVAGLFWGALAGVGTSVFYWNGASWCPYLSKWATYNPSLENLNIGGGNPYGGNVEARYRWNAGLVEVSLKGSFGAGASISGEVRMAIPEPYTYDGFNTANPFLEGQTIIMQNGRTFLGPVRAPTGNPSKVILGTTVANDTFAYATTWGSAQPINPQMYDEFFARFSYESRNYPF